MAQSKLVKANKEIAKKLAGMLEKIQHIVTGGYAKIEDAFVDCYLTRDSETVEDAKTRLKGKQI